VTDSGSCVSKDSYIQEDVFGELNAQLSRLEEEEEDGGMPEGDDSAMRELLQSAPGQDEDEASMLAPDFEAPPPAVRGRRQTVMAAYASQNVRCRFA
jgi:hypothetical protein